MGTYLREVCLEDQPGVPNRTLTRVVDCGLPAPACPAPQVFPDRVLTRVQECVPYLYLSIATYTANCPEGTTGVSVTKVALATSEISQVIADAEAAAAARTAAEAELVCASYAPVFPVCIYRTGGVGVSEEYPLGGPLGCGIRGPAVAYMTAHGIITVYGEGVRATGVNTGYSAYEIMAYDALGRVVYSAVANNQTGATPSINTGLNVEIVVNSADFIVGFPCAADEGNWCGCGWPTPALCTPPAPRSHIYLLDAGPLGLGSAIITWDEESDSWVYDNEDCGLGGIRSVSVRFDYEVDSFVVEGSKWEGSPNPPPGNCSTTGFAFNDPKDSEPFDITGEYQGGNIIVTIAPTPLPYPPKLDFSIPENSQYTPVAG